MPTQIRGFQPEIGIEHIEKRREGTPTLPMPPSIDLTGAQVRDRLEELYPDSRMERQLREFAAPGVSDPAILVPAQFESLIEEAFAILKENAKGSAARRLQDLLASEMKLRTQLSAMRKALLKA